MAELPYAEERMMIC